MSKFVNIAGQLALTEGEGDLILDSAIPGYITFEQAGVENGDVIGYVIWDNFGPFGPESREVGRGTYDNGTLIRDTIIATTDPDGGYINCSGYAQVYITALAEDIRSAYVDDTPPPNPYNGQLWWDNTTGELYIYYRDSDSSQWVSCNNTTGANTYPSQIGDINETLNNINHKLFNETINTSPSENINIENGTIIVLELTNDISLTDQMENGQTCLIQVIGNNNFNITWPTIKWINQVAPDTDPEYFVKLQKISNVLYGHYLGNIM